MNENNIQADNKNTASCKRLFQYEFSDAQFAELLNAELIANRHSEIIAPLNPADAKKQLIAAEQTARDNPTAANLAKCKELRARTAADITAERRLREAIAHNDYVAKVLPPVIPVYEAAEKR